MRLRCVKLRYSLRSLLVLMLLVCIVCAGAWWGWIRAAPIEGCWISSSLIQCLCDGEHFVRFDNGSCYLYGENHPPAAYFGSYKRVSPGVYELTVLDIEADVVVLKPRKRFMTWYSSTDGTQSYFTRLRETPNITHVLESHEIDYSTFEFFHSSPDD